jgi:hypothetical protein
MPLLDKYHLRCQNPECSQTTKLKSFPQLAAFLRRKDGDGILVKNQSNNAIHLSRHQNLNVLPVRPAAR